MNFKAFVKKNLAHLKNGERIGPPKDRVADDLDTVVEGVIDALKSEWRLYPDIYAWMITDAIREHLATPTPPTPTPPTESRSTMSTQRIITVLVDDSTTGVRATEVITRALPGSHILDNNDAGTLSNFEWDQDAPEFPMTKQDATAHMTPEGRITVLLTIDKEDFFAHIVDSTIDGASSQDDLAHDAAFDFGVTCDSATEIIGVTGDDFIVRYTTDIGSQLTDDEG